jgi:hypothetical protein
MLPFRATRISLCTQKRIRFGTSNPDVLEQEGDYVAIYKEAHQQTCECQILVRAQGVVEKSISMRLRIPVPNDAFEQVKEILLARLSLLPWRGC